jgi:hypothetical protein
MLKKVHPPIGGSEDSHFYRLTGTQLKLTALTKDDPRRQQAEPTEDAVRNRPALLSPQQSAWLLLS